MGKYYGIYTWNTFNVSIMDTSCTIYLYYYLTKL